MNDPSKWTELMNVQQEHNEMVNAFTCCNTEERLRLIFTMLLMMNERLTHIENQIKSGQK